MNNLNITQMIQLHNDYDHNIPKSKYKHWSQHRDKEFFAQIVKIYQENHINRNKAQLNSTCQPKEKLNKAALHSL